MKIGLLTEFFALGEANDSGLGQHFHILADALAANGYAVHVIHPSSTPSAVRAALTTLAPAWTWEVLDAQLPSLLWKPWRLSWSSKALFTHLWTALIVARHFRRSPAARSIEVIETHSYNIPAYFLVRRRVRPRLVTRVSTTMSQMVAISPVQARALRVEAILERQAIQRSDALVTHTREHRDIVCNLYGLAPSRFKLLPHGVIDNGPPTPTTAYEVASDREIVFLFVGRFEFRKGIDVLLDAIPEIAKSFPMARFILAGDRGDGTAWQSFVSAHPELASSRVQSLGRVSAAHLIQLYNNCDVFVAPSRYESFGLIYAEAMSHGKPVIGCRAGGIPDVIQHNVTGILSEPGDTASLVSAMRQLANDPQLRYRMGTAARADFLVRFSATRLAQASGAMYRDILPNLTV